MLRLTTHQKVVHTYSYTLSPFMVWKSLAAAAHCIHAMYVTKIMEVSVFVCFAG